MSFIDKIDLEPLNFPVELVPVFTMPNPHARVGALNEVSQDLARAVVRTDTGEALGIVGSKYNLARYSDQLLPVLKALDETGIVDASNINVRQDIYENGAMMELEIMLSDRQFDVGTTPGYSPSQPAYYNTSARVGDTVAQVLRFRNSYNGAWGFETSFGGKRLRCLNGVWALDSIATHRRKHTINLSVTASVEKVVKGITMFDSMRDELIDMTRTKVTTSQVQKLFKDTLAYLPRQDKDTPPFSDRTLAHLMNLWEYNADEVGANKWAAYNAATEWATHVEDTMRKTSQAHRVRSQREAKVASMMKAPQWAQLQYLPMAA